ncbi:hypothetical protein JXQ70_01250 [bacterium]|nr:hypothetical protein [bacterium]
MNLGKLKEAFEEFKKDAGDGLIASDIWPRAGAQSILGHNSQASATALFNRLSEQIDKSLETSKFPPIARFFMLELVGNKAVVISYLGKDYLWGILCDTSKLQIGLLLNVLLPMTSTKMTEAINA